MNDTNWPVDLPVLVGTLVCLREVVPADAPALVIEVTTPEVTRFIAPPPQTVAQFGAFIEWAIKDRTDAHSMTFAVLATGESAPVGLMSLRTPRAGEKAWNLGFVLGTRVWGTGVFVEAARLLLRFAFDVLQVAEIEAWCPADNGRGNGAMAKLGATGEMRSDATAPDGRRGRYIRWVIRSE